MKLLSTTAVGSLRGPILQVQDAWWPHAWSRMKALISGSPSETVFLRADKLIPYGEVLHVMDLIRKAGVTRIALVTVPMATPPGLTR